MDSRSPRFKRVRDTLIAQSARAIVSHADGNGLVRCPLRYRSVIVLMLAHPRSGQGSNLQPQG